MSNRVEFCSRCQRDLNPKDRPYSGLTTFITIVHQTEDDQTLHTFMALCNDCSQDLVEFLKEKQKPFIELLRDISMSSKRKPASDMFDLDAFERKLRELRDGN